MCYAELSARTPKAGSAYTYIYVSIGELLAFLIGWDLILEYVIGILICIILWVFKLNNFSFVLTYVLGSAATASAISSTIDSYFDNKIHHTFDKYFSLSWMGIDHSADFLAFAINVAATLFMLIGIGESTMLTKLLTLFNFMIIIFMIICGLTKVKIDNWQIEPQYQNLSFTDISNSTSVCSDQSRIGDGGFAPFGFYGILTGSARCFVAYIDFDTICASGKHDIQYIEKFLKLL